jgi:hypothetical protein
MLHVKSHIFLQLKIPTFNFFILVNKWLKTKKTKIKLKLTKKYMQKQSTNIQPPNQQYTNTQTYNATNKHTI